MCLQPCATRPNISLFNAFARSLMTQSSSSLSALLLLLLSSLLLLLLFWRCIYHRCCCCSSCSAVWLSYSSPNIMFNTVIVHRNIQWWWSQSPRSLTIQFLPQKRLIVACGVVQHLCSVCSSPRQKSSLGPELWTLPSVVMGHHYWSGQELILGVCLWLQ